jgi:hypothetical protein
VSRRAISGRSCGSFQIGVRERRQDAVVQRVERLRILDIEAVVALEVDCVDGARRRDLIDERGRPTRLGVELEAHAGTAGETTAHGLDRGLLAQPERVHEAHRLRPDAKHLVQSAAGLAQREIERRGLERPAAKTDRTGVLRRLRPKAERRQMLTEAGECPVPLKGQGRTRFMQRRAVLAKRRYVLAETAGTAPGQPYLRRNALEVMSEDGVQAFVLARLDHERQRRQSRPQ